MSERKKCGGKTEFDIMVDVGDWLLLVVLTTGLDAALFIEIEDASATKSVLIRTGVDAEDEREADKSKAVSIRLDARLFYGKFQRTSFSDSLPDEVDVSWSNKFRQTSRLDDQRSVS